MKRIKSCSTLRSKAHQLLNEEEREVFKYAIRNYRKNQSIDTLCEIISKIITDSNRSCLISLIADMLKEEQRSQFLHRCYSRLPGFNLSQHHLESSEFKVNKDFKSSNLSLRVATFVSKNRLSQSKSNYHIGSTSTAFDDGGSTLKINNTDNKKKISDPLNKSNNLVHSESEELLKTIERCSRKERPTLSNLKDKGFWNANNDSATDDDSMNSYSSLVDKDQVNKSNHLQINKLQECPRLNFGISSCKSSMVNGNEDRSRRPSNLRKTSTNKCKLMVCKLHFSSVNILEESEETVERLSVTTQSTAVSLFQSNSFDNIFAEYHLPPFSFLSPIISKVSSILQSGPFESQSIIQRSIQTQKDVFESNRDVSCGSRRDSNESHLSELRDNFVDQGCQTSFISTRDSSTQTFLA